MSSTRAIVVFIPNSEESNSTELNWRKCIYSPGPRGVQQIIRETFRCSGLSIHDENVIWACAGDHAALTISGIDITDVNPGYVLCSPKAPIKSTTKLKARIIVFDIEVPITRGFMVLFHYQTLSEPATIKKLNSLLHKSTGAVVQKKPRCLGKHANAEVEIHTARPICIELYKDFKDLGRFMLRYGGKTIAAGVVTEIL